MLGIGFVLYTEQEITSLSGIAEIDLELRLALWGVREKCALFDFCRYGVQTAIGEDFSGLEIILKSRLNEIGCLGVWNGIGIGIGWRKQMPRTLS